MRLAFVASAFALTGAAALILVPRALRAADDAPREVVERLMPQLLSDDDAARAEAEKKLFDLGEPGRAEIERMTRDADPRRAVTALRLLQSKGWAKAARKDGERRVYRLGENDESGRADVRILRLDDLEARIEGQMEELRKRLGNLDQDFTWVTPEFGVRGGSFHGSSSGSIVENDKKLSWTIDEDGGVKVTTQDGKDEPERTYEAKDLETLKKEHPDVAKRVEPLVGRSNARPFVLRIGPNGRTLFHGDVDGKHPFFLGAPQTGVLGVQWSPVTDVLREQLELPQGGMVVDAVVKDSLAEKLGVVKHDVLLELQGRPVDGSVEVKKALADVKAGEKVTALVVRKGQRKSLETTK
jgi:hypothetical protein